MVNSKEPLVVGGIVDFGKRHVSIQLGTIDSRTDSPHGKRALTGNGWTAWEKLKQFQHLYPNLEQG